MSIRGDEFDAVIVGSGATGGWAAMKLTRAGLRVAVVEAGRELEPARDFRDHTPPTEIPLRGKGLTRRTRQVQSHQRASYAFSEYNRHLFVDDSENPYSTPAQRPFEWIRGRQVGGKTLTWGRVALRFGPQDFHAASLDGVGEDWPLGYEELAPYYDEVEEFIGVSGREEGLAHLPDGRFTPPMHLSCAEQVLRAEAKRRFDRTLTISRTAVLTAPRPGRAPCHYCGPCERGCVTQSYFASPSSTLLAARLTGKLTLFPQTVVSHLTLSRPDRAKGVWCVDTRTGAHRELRGRTVLLCASTLESTRILLNSTSAAHPAGLGNGSGVLGRYLMDHLTVFTGLSSVPGFRGVPDAQGHRPTTFYVARFQNLGKRKEHFLRGYAFQGESHDCGPFGGAHALSGFGSELQRNLERLEREWYVWMVAFGECLPNERNACRLRPDRVDRWGIPTLEVDMAFGDNELRMVEHIRRSSAELLDCLGTEPTGAFVGTPGSAVHEVGTARMGADPTRSFANRWNQSHEVRNVFVLDGAALPSSPCQNPTLTLMALAARASDHLVSELKSRNL